MNKNITYTVEQILYEEVYRTKLPFMYFIFTKFALFLTLFSYVVFVEMFKFEMVTYVSILFMILMLGYKNQYEI